MLADFVGIGRADQNTLLRCEAAVVSKRSAAIHLTFFLKA
jgi:hypothetical protein